MARFDLYVSDNIDAALVDIALRYRISKEEAIRRAFALLSVADDALRDGRSMGIVKADAQTGLQAVCEVRVL
ncbi:MAG: hypothetical protein ACRYF9_26320 [Janthinobacterium lividum]|uniref:hypothetical protein n=1 Tax=Pseudomonas sp. MWU16-30317 TaxID=2878095 RepID=UPI001CFA7BA7|nr:hypothetical protein [Pseudomonas sp. MWU16-30317]